jgi:hypothetical protein
MAASFPLPDDAARPPAPPPAFHQEVLRGLHDRGLTHEQASLKAGLSLGTVSYWLRSGKYPRRASLERFIAALGAPAPVADRWRAECEAGNHPKAVQATCRGCGATDSRTVSRWALNALYDPATATYLCDACWYGKDAGDQRGRGQRSETLTCRACGKTIRKYLCELDVTATLDRATSTYLCKDCQVAEARSRRVAVTCRRCYISTEMVPSRAAGLESIQWSATGATYLCGPCGGHDAAPRLRAALQRLYEPTPPDEALAKHIRAVTAEAGGRAHLLELARRAARAGQSDKARRHRGILYRVNGAPRGARAGEFRLCPVCRLLTYLLPSQVRRGASGSHQRCEREWRRSSEYREWRRSLGNSRSPLFALRRQGSPPPRPRRPGGRPPAAAQLEARFRFVLRHFLLHQSWREIGRLEHYTHGAVTQGVRALIAVLPDTWVEVFGNNLTGQRLDAWLPIQRLRAWAQGGGD